ncbi:MAG: chemotaxis protein CheW [Acidobacteria bacterium]|nr:MAG: chemotaxis protein CheW [Acidobacteriota bacterium]
MSNLNDTSISPALVMKVGEFRCALPLRHVLETMRPLPIQPLACAPDFVLGLSVIRGEPVPVVDLASLLQIPSDPPSRFVVVRAGDRRVALAVELIAGTRAVTPQSLSSVPPLLAGAPAVSVAAIGSLDKQLLLVLETACLIPDEVWASLAGSEER